jgi:hypothetical protein
MDFLAIEQMKAQLSQKCQPYLSIPFLPNSLSPHALITLNCTFFYKKYNMNIANLEKKQYLCTVEYFVADRNKTEHHHGA